MKTFIKTQLFIVFSLWCIDGFAMTAAQQSQQIQNEQSCLNWETRVDEFCGQGNPLFAQAQQQVAACNALLRGSQGGNGTQGITTTALAGNRCTREEMKALEEINQVCNQAVSQCNVRCGTEAKELISRNTGPNFPLNPDIEQRNQVAQTCEQKRVQSESEIAAMQMNLGEILAGLAAVMQALGIGQGGNDAQIAGLDDEDKDKCDDSNPYAKYLIECKGQSDPKGTRGGLTGVAGLNGKTGNGLSGLMGASTEGEPGGESKGKNSGSGAGNPFNTAGLGGGLGSGGSGGGSGAGASGKKDSGLNTDVQKWGGGGGYASGGGGGRSGGGRPAMFNGAGNVNAAGLVGKAALNRKLSALKSQARMPASTGGANGPFEDNWSVVNKAYKKNSSSMFHQQ